MKGKTEIVAVLSVLFIRQTVSVTISTGHSRNFSLETSCRDIAVVPESEASGPLPFDVFRRALWNNSHYLGKCLLHCAFGRVSAESR